MEQGKRHNLMSNFILLFKYELIFFTMIGITLLYFITGNTGKNVMNFTMFNIFDFSLH